jgi:serine/threonine protein kinase/WD40 repeat protein
MMAERSDESRAFNDVPCDSSDDDDRVGEAVEAYLALAEQGQAPEVEEFAARYPELRDDVRAALDGLELVHGLLGLGSAPGSGSGRGRGMDHRIESGRRIAGYRVVSELGRGGMGTVYEAVHMGLDRPVALKVLGLHAAPDSSARRRFLNEARTAAGLHHTHIVPVFDVGQVGGLCYYAMQRIEGSGLDRVVRHLRRTRPSTSGGGGPAGSRSLIKDALGGSGGSSRFARLGNLWVRMSSGWLRRQHPHGRSGNGVTAAAAALSSVGTGEGAHLGLADSTASWGTGSRLTRLHESKAGDQPGGSAPACASQGVLAAMGPAPGRREDDTPPFDPPHGFSYFRWVAEVGRQSADALAHAHHQGVIHRDVKPSNLLIDSKGNIWVTDFGLARRLADPGVTHHDTLLGTPRYMSPEQARTGSIDGRTDVYSLGATLYELLTLRPPFDGRSAAELIEQIGQNEPAAPNSVDGRVPRDLETIVLKALAKRPADRYATATAMAEDLARFLNHEPVKARRISPAGRLWRVARRHPGITVVTTAAAAAIVAITTYAYVRVRGERDQAISATRLKEEALDSANEAYRQTRAAMKEQLLQTAKFVASTEVPDRRSRGLELIRKAVAPELEPEPELRAQLRDVAVKFLVLRDVETRPELATPRAHGLVFGRNGSRLAVLSEDDDELAFWNVERRERLTSFSLRAGSGAAAGFSDSNLSESSTTDVAEPGQSAQSTGRSGRAGTRAGASTGAAVSPARRFGSRRMALVGHFVAALLPDDSGVRLIDAFSGAPLRTLHRRDSSVVGVLGDPAGQRLVTIESLSDDAMSAAMEGLPDWDPTEFHGTHQINLWDPDHVDAPIASLNWSTPPGPPPRSGSNAPTTSQSIWPLVAISPDGKTIAAGPWNGSWVRLFSAEDGKRKGRNGFIPTQPHLSALALGPNAMLATAGNGTVRIYDLDTGSFPTSMTPTQNITWVMRFSPQGSLLALGGLGPIELWDPVSHSLVNQLPNSEQANDLAFTPDGKTLAAAGRAGGTLVWTIIDSAMRTQLSGFDARPSSLAFGADGVLAGGSSDGTVWFWRAGRCPEIAKPWPPSVSIAKNEKDAWPERASSPAGRDGMNRRGGGPPDYGRPPRGREPNQERERPTAVAFDAQGRLVVHDIQGLRIWPEKPASAQTPPILEFPLPFAPGTWANHTPMAKTPEGQMMVLVRSSSLFLWRADAKDRLITVIAPPHTGAEPALGVPVGPRRSASAGAEPPLRFRAVQLAPGGDRIYLIDQSGVLHAWTLENSGDGPLGLAQVQARAMDLSVPLTEGASSLALRPDGAILAVGDRAGTVTLLDTTALRVLARIKPSSGEVESLLLALAFSPNGHNLAVGSQQGMISIWSVARPTRPRLRLRLPGHKGLVTNLVFDRLGQRLASATVVDPLVEVWDLNLIEHELIRLKLAE